MRHLAKLFFSIFASLLLSLTFSTTHSALAQNTYVGQQLPNAQIVPGTTDTGNHCDGCATPITLPFPYTFYGQTFTTANVTSNGSLQFAGSNAAGNIPCLPAPGYSYTIFPFGANLLTNQEGGGIFTSVTGSAPNRIFNIEWRAQNSVPGFTGFNQRFELQLFEGQLRLDFLYGGISNKTDGPIGLQKDTNSFDEIFCGTATANWAGMHFAFTPGIDLVISEFRLRGPNGPNDEFIEIYNTANIPRSVLAPDGTAGLAVVASDGGKRCTIPNGTVIPAHGHFLCANNSANSYSLGSYPAGSGTTAIPDATFTTDIPDNAGLVLFNSADPVFFSAVTRIDAVGSTSVNNRLYKEGAGYAPLSGAAYDNGSNYSLHRKFDPITGLPIDTNNNVADFVLVAPDAATLGTQTATLGSPGPENLSSPVINNNIAISLVDPLTSRSGSPNFVRTGSGNSGTLAIRRRFTNNTGATVTRLRFRVFDITTLNSPVINPPQADLRLTDSTDEMVSTTLGPITVKGTQLETPPAQALGGGLNTSATVALPAGGLVNGNSLDVQFLLNVVANGRFRFFINVEVLP